MKTGIELIAEERQRQIKEEGYDSSHDDEHTGQELALAAAMYATPVMLYERRDSARVFEFRQPDIVYDWDLDVRRTDHNITLSDTKRLKQLVKAGALILAEIDRLQRLEK